MQNAAPYLAFARRLVYVKQHDMPENPPFDLRLEFEGRLKSWALRKCVRYYPGDRYEAIDVSACLRKSVLKFTLYAEKLKGSWTLTRTEEIRRSWGTGKKEPHSEWTLFDM